MKAPHWRQKLENLRLKAAGSWDVLTDAVTNYGLNGDTNQAAAIALYAILSVIPLFILTIVVAEYMFNSYPHVQEYITDAINRGFFSEKLLSQLGQIEKKRKVLGWVGVLGLIWLSSAIFNSLATSLSIIFRSEKKRNYFLAQLLAIAMIPLAWIVGIASVALSYITALLVSQPAQFMDNLGFSLSAASVVLLRYFVPYFITTLFFVIVYRVIPTAQIRPAVAVAGSAIAALLLEITKQFFTWYIARFAHYDVIFGSLAAVVILVVGVFYIALVFLFCAEMMSSYQRRDILLLERAILKPHKAIMRVDERLFKKFGRVYEEDSIIFNEGDKGHEMFYVLSGRVFLEKVDCQVKKVLAEMGPGQYFGEMAALIDTTRSATARAIENSNLAVIDGNTFSDMLRESRDVALHMLREFSRRVINSNRGLEELTNLWICLAIVIYFMDNPGAIVEEHLPYLATITKKEPALIGEILEELARQGVVTVKNGLLTEVSRERMWILLDSRELGKCFVAERDKI